MFNLEEISKKYGLSVVDVQEIVDETVSKTFSELLGHDAEFVMGEKSIYLYGDKEKIILPAEKVKKNIVRLIRFRLENSLQGYSTITSYQADKSLTGTVAGGHIAQVYSDSIYVDVLSDRGVLHGTCKLSHQTPKERGKYKPNEYYNFYVNKVSLVKKKNVLHKEISLSRTSKRLVCGLFEKELSSRFIGDIVVICTRRIAGVMSEVSVSKKMPKECITAVQKELKERVIVQY